MESERLTAQALERQMAAQFGDDFRDKAIVGPLGTFRLADAFDECGLRDPRAPYDPPLGGLFQHSNPRFTAPRDVAGAAAAWLERGSR